MAYDYIKRGKAEENGYTNTKVFKMFGISSTGYYDYVARKEDRSGKLAAKRRDENYVIRCFKRIIRRLGFVPGKRTFRRHMFRRFNYKISVSRTSKIMKKMQITAQLPKKDAYKGQATHHHECMAKPNLVNRNFKLGVRQVVLTDITYIHYVYYRTPAYMCVFKDAYTTEILGCAVSSKMDVALIQEAFNNMMDNHKSEFPKDMEVYCHSDQGSQYLSTTFKQLLNENDFIQSMSRRGNSQDNAPMESFFGRMKTEIIDIIARCKNLDTVKQLINGYINMHNNERYQENLAALSPSEFYTYKVTGQYPLDNYYGIEATELMSLEQIIEAKLEMQEKKKELKISPPSEGDKKMIDMNNNTDLLKEYASLAGKEDEKSEARKIEILNYIKLNADDSDREEAKAFISQKMEQLQSEVLTLREQLAEEDYKLLPLRYIAQEYFGKSAAWLSQRLNGSEVRGHIYTLNSEQKDIFNRAVKEIGQRISSLQLA